jgi:hypothetical protein
MLGTSWAILTACCLVTAATFPAVSAPADQDPVIVIRMENAESIDQENLRRAHALATDIYAQAGVSLEWNSGPAPANRTLTIVLTTTKTAPRGISPESMGVAPSPGDGSRGTKAYIFMDKVAAFTAAHRVAADYVLACAMAHEIGHLLLPPNAHRADGIMQGNWHPALFPPRAPGLPGFPGDQARLLRTRSASR